MPLSIPDLCTLTYFYLSYIRLLISYLLDFCWSCLRTDLCLKTLLSDECVAFDKLMALFVVYDTSIVERNKLKIQRKDECFL